MSDCPHAPLTLIATMLTPICILLVLLRLWQAPDCHMESATTYWALSLFPSGTPTFDSTEGTRRDRSQMTGDDSKPSWLIPPARPSELRERRAGSIALHLASWRRHFRELAKTQWEAQWETSPSLLPRLAPSPLPWGVSLTCLGDPYVAWCQPLRCWK